MKSEPRMRTNKAGKKYYEFQRVINGERRTFTAPTISEVYEKYQEAVSGNKRRYTFGQAADDWIDRRKVKATSKRKYEQVLLSLAKYNNLDLAKFNPIKIDNELNSLELAYPTKKLIYFVLKSVLIYAEKTGKIAPIDKTELKPRKSDVINKRNAFDVQCDDIVLNLCYSNHPCAWVYRTGYYTGMRIGEILALQASDVQDGVISITKTLVRVDGQTQLQTPKTARGVRDIPLPRELSDLPKHLPFAITYTRAWWNFKQLTGRTLHELRHNFATRLILGGVDIQTASELLGESTETMLQNYTHSNLEKKRQAINAVFTAQNCTRSKSKTPAKGRK